MSISTAPAGRGPVLFGECRLHFLGEAGIPLAGVQLGGQALVQLLHIRQLDGEALGHVLLGAGALVDRGDHALEFGLLLVGEVVHPLELGAAAGDEGNDLGLDLGLDRFEGIGRRGLVGDDLGLDGPWRRVGQGVVILAADDDAGRVEEAVALAVGGSGTAHLHGVGGPGRRAP